MTNNNERKIAFVDIDGTVLPSAVGIFSVATNLTQVGLMDGRGSDAMHQDRDEYHQGILPYEDFGTRVLTHLAEGVRGQSYSEVLAQSNRFLVSYEDQFYPYAKIVIPHLLQTHDVYFVTANSQFYAQFFTEYYKTTGFRATILEVTHNRFTGIVTSYLTRAEEKAAVISELLNKHGYHGSIAFGDAEGDKHVLAQVQLPICVNPTAGLRTLATEKEWIITDHLGVANFVPGL